MSLRGEKLHAFIRGLGQPKDSELAREVFDETSMLFRKHNIATPDQRETHIEEMADYRLGHIANVAEAFEADHVRDLVRAIFNYEGWFILPDIDWTRRRTTSEWWQLRDELIIQRDLALNFDDNMELIAETLANLFGPVAENSLSLDKSQKHSGSIQVKSAKMELLTRLPQVVDHMLSAPYRDGNIDNDLFSAIRQRLDRNLITASGGNPDDPSGFRRQVILPEKSDIKDRSELIKNYLGGTPLTRFFDGQFDFVIPAETRFEHHHIIAGTGHGKTQTLQYLIANDLDAVAEGKASVIVIDSQGDLIRTISNLKQFAPSHPLHERIVIIDPTDVEYPVSLNMFDVGLERLKSYPMLERERLTNSILELYDFVLGSLLDAGMTQKQNVIFRYVTRLMLHIPDATIHTLRELMEPDGALKYAGAIAKLEGSARHFFETEFNSKEFQQTKSQVLRRLWGILENQSFERMFSHPRSKLDLFSEMNAGKIILINTAKDLLKENGTQIFGRFFIALIAQAAQERATLPDHKRLPAFVYVDEAADYFDQNIGIILSQARKYNVGIVLAHQYLGQLTPALQEAFSANTSIKFAGGVSSRDARTLASMMRCETSFIEHQKKGSFTTSVRGLTQGAISLSFPFGHVEKMENLTAKERGELRDMMRVKYAVHYSKLNVGESEKVDGGEDPVEGSDDEDVGPSDPDTQDTGAGKKW